MSVVSTLRMYMRRTPTLDEPTDLYTHEVQLLDGSSLDLASLRGKPTLIVNTASKCDYTGQYEGLQALHERYADRGLQMLGFPSADFANQEFDQAGEIAEFCATNYTISFALTERTSVRADPSRGARIAEGFPYLWAEVAHAVRREMALTLDDLLIRRMHLFYQARDGGLSVARAVAERMAAEEGIGWDAAEVDRQVERYRAAVETTRGFGR